MAVGVGGHETHMELTRTRHPKGMLKHGMYRIRQHARCTIGIITDIIIHRPVHIIILIHPAWEEQDIIGRQIIVFRNLEYILVM